MEANNNSWKTISIHFAFQYGGGCAFKGCFSPLSSVVYWVYSWSPNPKTVCKLSIQFYGNQLYINLFPLWTSVLAGSTRCIYNSPANSPATCCATPRLTGFNVRLWLTASLPSVFFSTCCVSAFPKLTERSMRISQRRRLFVTSVRKKMEPFWRRSLGGFVFLFFSHSHAFHFFLGGLFEDLWLLSNLHNLGRQLVWRDFCLFIFLRCIRQRDFGWDHPHSWPQEYQCCHLPHREIASLMKRFSTTMIP